MLTKRNNNTTHISNISYSNITLTILYWYLLRILYLFIYYCITMLNMLSSRNTTWRVWGTDLLVNPDWHQELVNGLHINKR